MDMRFQLETLIKSKNEAVRRYDELVKSLNQTCLDDNSINASGLDSGSQNLNAGLNLMALPSDHTPPARGNTHVKNSPPETNTGDKNCDNQDLTKGLTEALADCHKAASGLSECLHIVHIQWRAVQKYDGDDIWNNYRLTNKAMRALEVVQAMSPRANPSMSNAQLQAPQQQHQQHLPRPVGGKAKPKPAHLRLEIKSRESMLAPVAASSTSKEKSTESPSLMTQSSPDDWPVASPSKKHIDCAPQASPPSDNLKRREDNFEPPFPPLDNRPPSRSPCPARGRNGSLGNRVRSSSGASDQRDYILDLANPERAPSNDNSKLVQKHPATFQCHLCPKTFTRAYNLRSHLRTHTDEKPFLCTVCGKAFARQHDRKRHEGLHNGEKKFVCQGNLESGVLWGCGRRFARADALCRHIRSEAGRVCIKPLREEERASRRQSLEKVDATTRPNPNTGGFKIETGSSRVEEASLRIDQELPAVLLQQYPALATVADTSDVSNPLSQGEDKAGDHDADVPIREFLYMGAYRSHRKTPSDTYSGYSGDSGRNSPYLRHSVVDNSSNPSQEIIGDSPLTRSDMDSQDTEDPVDALLREWTTVQVC